jgi:hypothetical protein
MLMMNHHMMGAEPIEENQDEEDMGDEEDEEGNHQ